ncbi:hypothetical protein ACSTLP_24650, partial [Vibrio parahaemolyticus]
KNTNRYHFQSSYCKQLSHKLALIGRKNMQNTGGCFSVIAYSFTNPQNDTLHQFAYSFCFYITQLL